MSKNETILHKFLNIPTPRERLQANLKRLTEPQARLSLWRMGVAKKSSVLGNFADALLVDSDSQFQFRF